MKATERVSGDRNIAKSNAASSLNAQSNHCGHCQCDTKSRRRDFSEQTWTVLLVWGEIDTKTVDQALCDPCYNELREVLIDRTDEIEAALASHASGGKPAAMKAGTPKATASKSRKSGKLAG